MMTEPPVSPFSRSDESGAVAAAEAALERHRTDPTHLLQILIETQDRLAWLPPPALTRIAAGLALPRAEVDGVAGFYSFLHLQPVGRYRVLFADNIIEEMQGSRALMQELCRLLWLEPGKPSVSIDRFIRVDQPIVEQWDTKYELA